MLIREDQHSFLLAAIWSSWDKAAGQVRGERMGSRIDRLERLDELRRSGALTDAEYEHEKVRTLQGSIVDPPQVPVESAAWVATEADDTPVLSGIRASWAASPLGRNKPLALATAIVSALLLGLLLRSLLVAGLWLAVCSAGAHWLYTGLRIEQKREHEAGTAPWRVCFYVACGLVLLGVVLPRITGGRSGLHTVPAATEVASVDDAGVVSSNEDQQVSEPRSAGAGSRMSCRSAMEIAAVASCGIQLENAKAGSMAFGGNYRAQTKGYEKSLYNISPPLHPLCSDAVQEGRNAVNAGVGDAWQALSTHEGIRTLRYAFVFQAGSMTWMRSVNIMLSRVSSLSFRRPYDLTGVSAETL